jgi:hypothetical protein
MLRDPTHRAAMGANARRLAEQHDFAATVDQLIKIYTELPPRPTGPAA